MLIELILLTLIIISIIGYKNKITYALICLMMILLMAFTTANADLDAYMARYEMSEQISSIMVQEPLWGVLLFMCKHYKLSYSGLLIIICVIGLTVIYRCLKKYSLMPSLVLALYFILFFSGHMIQLRAFIAEWIVIYALLYLVESKKISVIKYTVMILFSAGIQFSTIFFLCFVIAKYRKNVREEMFFYVSVFWAAFPIIIKALTNSSYPLLRIKAQSYLNSTYRNISTNTILFISLFVIGSCVIIGISMKKKEIIGENWKIKFNVLAAINIISFICLGLILIYNNNFFRYNRVVMIVNIIMLSNYYFEKKKLNVKIRGITVCMCSLAFVFLELFHHTWYFQIMHNSILKNIF